MVVQSTSPYHAKKAFQAIGVTLQASGFAHVEQYHHNVPSFGEWGWSIATKTGAPASDRIRRLEQLPIDDPWVSRELLLASFVFAKNFYQNIDSIEPNFLGSHQLYQYHRQAWKRDQGLYTDIQTLGD